MIFKLILNPSSHKNKMIEIYKLIIQLIMVPLLFIIIHKMHSIKE